MPTAHAPNRQAIEFDPDLIERYEGPAPRYTSYPTAPQFHKGFGAVELAAAIERSNRAVPARPLSLYVHIPFCWSPCFYCGCNRIITHDKGRSDTYLAALDCELDRLAPLFAPGRLVRQLHLGGGTPNFLAVEQLAALMASLKRRFHFPDDAEDVEAGVEIDPRFADADYMRRLGAIGFNRVSIGVQDFNPAVQQAVNRIQSVAETEAVVTGARSGGFRSVNIDLIYGLPKQTLAGFAATLDEVIRIAPDRVAVYGYAHMPRLFKAQRKILPEDMPDPALRLRLLGLAIERLGAAGYLYVGMDHFARPEDELVRAQDAGTLQRNFQGYSTRGECDIVGLGMSAIGRIGNTYSQNARDLAGYYLELGHGWLPIMRGIELDADDVLRRAVISELMCHGRIDMAPFGAAYGITFADYFACELERLSSLVDDGLVELEPGAIVVTPRGRLLLRVIAAVFDAYLAEERGTAEPRYSRAI
ncbi:MAG TPA: oxygen-independent coproporphyrinogen III oxidase [Rhodanobacteraceae bacterium]|nr:oxygen-independent coproporphyrinogen III oxidase [Rhodanobacteraceae bacterium]